MCHGSPWRGDFEQVLCGVEEVLSKTHSLIQLCCKVYKKREVLVWLGISTHLQKLLTPCASRSSSLLWHSLAPSTHT